MADPDKSGWPPVYVSMNRSRHELAIREVSRTVHLHHQKIHPSPDIMATAAPVKIPNPLHPDQMSAEERIAEIGQLLACGLVRLQARNASPLSADRGDSFVDFPAPQSGHTDAVERRSA